MGLIGKFNGLHGQVRTRKQIEVLISEAYMHEQPAVAKRLEAVLAANPKDKAFTLKISKPAIEVVPASFLDCLDCEEDKDNKITGLGKAVSPDEIYQMITDKMVKLIKEANAKDWRKKWDARAKGTGYLLPYNFASKKMYRGINRVLLTGFDVLENPFFLTFKQVEQLKGKVRKGAKGYEVVYFTKLYLYQDTKKKIDISSYDLEKFVAMLAAKGIDTKNPAQHALPILKYYKVFNGKDIEGIDFDLKNFKHGFIESHAPATQANQMPIADAIIKHYPAPAPKLEIGGDSAHYRPGKDILAMPHLADFETIQDYYNVYFHELSHSTGHPSRLNRKIANRFGSKDYAFEELIAEFGATFLSAEAGIIWHTNKNHAAYLKNWNSALTHLKDDNRFIMRAATQAQKVADFVLQYDAKGDPAYFADLKKTIKAKKTKKTVKPKAKKETASKKIESTVTPPSYSRRPKSISVKKPVQKPQGLKAPVMVVPETLPIERVEELPEIEETEMVVDPVEEIYVAPAAPRISKNPLVQNIGNKSTVAPSQYFKVNGEVGKFLQRVERKPEHSVVITLDGEQGAGKTTTLYHFMDAFATPGNSCLYISGEEHPNSELATSKENKYLSTQARQNIDTVAEVRDAQQLYELIADYEIIFIDSWQKLLRMVGQLRLDEDLRKRFDGKVFIIIFQQTTTGRTKGGAEVVFDGDIIIKMVKEASFADNYAYFDKNRYTLVPLETIQYNIATGTVYNPEGEKEHEAPQIEVPKPKGQLNFSVV